MLSAPQSQWGTGPVGPHPRNPFPRPTLSFSGHTMWPATPTPGPSAEGRLPHPSLLKGKRGLAWAETLLLTSGVPAISLPSPDPPGAPACVPWVHLPSSPAPLKCCRGPRARVVPGTKPHSRPAPCFSRFPATCRHGGVGCPLPGVCGFRSPVPLSYVGRGLPARGTNSTWVQSCTAPLPYPNGAEVSVGVKAGRGGGWG